MQSDSETPAERDVRWVFLGPKGIRAGWGILLFASVWFLLTFFSNSLFLPLLDWQPDAPLPPLTGIAMELIQFVPAVIATWMMSIIERRPVTSFGFQGKTRIVRLLSGMGWGFTAITSLVLTMWKLGHLSLGKASLTIGEATHDAILWGLAFLLTGFFEESLFRGYIQLTLTRGIGFWCGAFLFAAIFGLTHVTNPGESPVGLVSVVGAGLIFSLSLWYTGSLWWAVGFHATWDWGQSFFYGTPDSGLTSQGHLFEAHPVGSMIWSGGLTGPEGSILIVPWLAIMALLMYLWWGRRTSSPFSGAAWRPARDHSLSPRRNWFDSELPLVD